MEILSIVLPENCETDESLYYEWTLNLKKEHDLINLSASIQLLKLNISNNMSVNGADSFKIHTIMHILLFGHPCSLARYSGLDADVSFSYKLHFVCPDQ